MKQVVITGGTGYLGRPLIERLVQQGLDVRAVARPESIRKLPSGCVPVPGNVLDSSTYRDHISRGSTFLHLVGVPHPAPWKAEAFRAIDLVSLRESVTAATRAGVAHFVYV